jgi:hypothetical protein
MGTQGPMHSKVGGCFACQTLGHRLAPQSATCRLGDWNGPWRFYALTADHVLCQEAHLTSLGSVPSDQDGGKPYT